MKPAEGLPAVADPYRPRRVYRRLLGYSAQHWRRLLVAIFGMVVFAGTDVTLVGMIKTLTDGSFVQRDPQIIRWLPLEIIGLFLVRGVAGFLSSYAMAAVGQAVVSRLRCEVFEHLLAVPVSHHDRARNADLQTKLTYHAGQVADSATSVVTSVVRDGLTAIGLLGRMFYTSWSLTLYALIIAPLVALSIDWVNRRFRTISKRIQHSVSGMTHSADEAINGRRVVKIYGGEHFALGQFRRLDDYLRRQNIKMATASAASNGVLEFIAALAIALLVYLATLPSMLSQMTPGTFVAFIGAMLLLRQPISNMTGLSERLQRGVTAGTELFKFLDTPVEPDRGRLPLPRASGHLQFDAVHFHYGDDTREALAGISLEVPAGKTVAFVGQSGSGKSTLLSLLPRFYDPSAGAIRLDGHDLRDYTLRDLRRQITLVDQNVVLFNASVADNIAYGSAAPDRAAIEAAARRASAWEFISELPQGLDTPIGQNGGVLSGGQRQRLAIARALYKDAPILILDEATSALDTESERAIQQALEELQRGRTTLVIAHRLSTIQNADWIVVMKHGHIVEQGTHAELLAHDGHYALLHRLQFREDAEPALS